jgi:inhibitor of KinA sporulation pathway (predicted exonuclease)
MQASSIFVGRFTICTPATYLDTIAKCDIDALNRYPFVKDNPDSGENCQDSVKIQQQNEAHTTKLMMHMFPRQFSLHNVFTSPTDSNQTAQKFHDYTFREDEINKSLRVANRSTKKALPKLPKRLRGTTRDLVRSFSNIIARRFSTSLTKIRTELEMGNRQQPRFLLRAVQLKQDLSPNDELGCITQIRRLFPNTSLLWNYHAQRHLFLHFVKPSFQR